MKAREIEHLVDHMVQAAPQAKRINFDLETFTAFAAQVGHPDTSIHLSNGLQQYRVTRDRKYDVSAQSYGRAARWVVRGIQGRPSRARMGETYEQDRHRVEDAILREYNDLRYEVLPAMVQNGVSKAERQHKVAAFEVHGVERLVGVGVVYVAAVAAMNEKAITLRTRFAA
jgi:hypothetical protein